MSEKVSAGEVRAAVQHIEKEGRLPPGLAQAIYEHTTGWRPEQSALPPHRRAPQQSKEDEILDVGLRLQQKASEFAGNKPLTIDAYLRGDKATAASLENGFDQKAIDDVFAVLKRNEKYGGEPITPEIIAQMKDVMGEPSQDLEKYAKAIPPKPVLPKGVAQEAQGVVQIAEQPSAQGQVQQSGMSSLRHAIFGGESSGNYNIVNRGQRHGYGASTDFNLSDKSIDEVLADQDRGVYKAAGAYQIIPSTLREAMRALGLSGNEKFTAEIQDRIFADYLAKDKRPPLRDYIMGRNNNIKAAHTALAQEWASVDRGDGLSYYHGDGVNKAHIPLNQSMGALQDMRNQYQANIDKGMNETDAYRSALLTGSGLTPQYQQSFGGRQFLGGGEPQGQPATDRQPIYADTSQTPSDNKQSETLRYAGDTTSNMHRVNWTALAKDVFNTKRSSYVPKYVSQAVKGAIRGV